MPDAPVSDTETVDYLIIGGGPAGLQAGYFLKNSGYSYLIVESGSAPGTFFTNFPRHRKLISINKVHTESSDPELKLRTDWNSLLCEDDELRLTRYSPRYFPAADDLVRYLADFAASHRMAIRYDTRIVEVTRPGEFHAKDQHGNVHRARRVIAATGVTQPYIPEIPGAETAERYDTVSVDPADFTGQKVLIVGKANSAFETADNLIETASTIHVAGPGSLRLAWQTHFVGHLRAVNNNFLDTYQLKSENALLDGHIRNIEQQPDSSYLVTISFSRVNEISKEIRYDRVILATGFRFDASIFAPDCRPELTIRDRFPAQTEAWESTNVPDLYFAGTITQVRDFKKSTSGFIHGFRYGVRALHNILGERYHEEPWPHRDLRADPAELTAAVTERVNRSSALWQLFGFLGDVIVVDRTGNARYYEEVPLDYLGPAIREGRFGEVDTYFAITLEYGADHDQVNPFDVAEQRIAQDDAANALDGRYLHPVLRQFRDGEQTAEHHITENLENVWTSETVHLAPLRRFFTDTSGPVAVDDRS